MSEKVLYPTRPKVEVGTKENIQSVRPEVQETFVVRKKNDKKCSTKKRGQQRYRTVSEGVRD